MQKSNQHRNVEAKNRESNRMVIIAINRQNTLSLVICVPLPGKHISLVICVPLSGKHISLVICVLLLGNTDP